MSDRPENLLRKPLCLRSGIQWTDKCCVKVYLPEAAINPSDQKEFVSNDRFEESIRSFSSERANFDDVVFKSDFIRTFRTSAHLIDVRAGQNVLELGAAHGWASVLVKCDHPSAYVVASDLVPECVSHSAGYEVMLGTALDEKCAFSVRDIPFADAQFDRIFTFASFHHFGDRGDYRKSLAEIARILKPDGKLVLLYEPASPRFFYPSAYRRVNRRRSHEGVDEDVLVVKKLEATARPLGMSLRAIQFPIFRYRSSLAASLYYYLLSKLHLGRFMVCTVNIIMHKA
jgi:SAM-dependent methyltransferase